MYKSILRSIFALLFLSVFMLNAQHAPTESLIKSFLKSAFNITCAKVNIPKTDILVKGLGREGLEETYRPPVNKNGAPRSGEPHRLSEKYRVLYGHGGGDRQFGCPGQLEGQKR